jgi:uncharacterized membrane protein YedE/YeeE
MWSGLLTDAHLVAAVGVLGGIVLGLAARLGRFCTMGAIEDALYGGSDHRLRMWGVAIATAMVLSFGLMQAGLLTASETPYLRNAWNPVGHVAGGLLFGYGMALAGNCGFGALARLGGGDLRSFVIVLVMGIAAYVTMSGPLAWARVRLFPDDLVATEGPAGYAHALEAATGIGAPIAGMAIGLALLAILLRTASFRAERAMIAWGAAVGAAVAFAWAGTQWVRTESLGAVPVESFTFAAPLGDSILYGMTASGRTLSFGVGSVAGVWTGAFLGSLWRGHFRWEACEDPRELRRQIFGAALMGVGAVLAVGCTIGQGVSAMSLLAFGAPLTLAGIFAGAALGLRQLIHGFASA